ncbi:hypothetical protein [Candidatus Stoquefichus massiliensis]|uniref:hypothetical protein n=1 Tax=Candidatus Stoquefichus massiliensis TaxID=1470350 RepID=UPI000483C090|nr:hypothetical protein [Candidatus Stoquefichus massiliensis]
MKTLAISMGRFSKDFMVQEGSVNYQNVSLFQSISSKYIKIKNNSQYPICFCIPAKADESGLILEMNSQTENVINKDIFHLLSREYLRIGYFIDEKKTIANKLVLEAHDFYLNKNTIQFNVYRMKIDMNGVSFWPIELGIHQLIYMRIVSVTGKQVINENVIDPVITTKLFYEFHLEDYAFNIYDKIKEVYCVFNLEYKL